MKELVVYTSFITVVIYFGWLVCLVIFGREKRRCNIKYQKFKNIDQLLILVPALNEASIIEHTIASFLKSVKGLPVKMILIDDDSSDGTGDIVKAFIEEHNCQNSVEIVQRKKPNAQTGKGDSLNYAYQWILQHGSYDLKKTVIGVIDADAYMFRSSYQRVMQCFEDNKELALLQTRVAMFNKRNWLQWMQDIEFSVVNDWIQNTRNIIGNSAASGNGQFIRLSKVDRQSPWGNALLEDFEFSTRFLLEDKQTLYLGEAVVYQEAVNKVKPFVRQRSRWTQGGLDCIGKYWIEILKSKSINLGAKLEMTFYMFLPFITLLAGIANVAVLYIVLSDIKYYYLLIIGLLLINLGVNSVIIDYYLRNTNEVTLIRGLYMCVTMVLYNYLLFPAIVIAIYRKIRGNNKWIKTTHGSN